MWGCPMAGKHRYVEFRRYPTYEKAYIHAFDRMLETRKANGKEGTWQTGYDAVSYTHLDVYKRQV